MARGGREGRQRERMVAEKLREDGWTVVKGTTYGVADLVALKAGERPWLIEVKSTVHGPFDTFRPADRRALSGSATRAGARAVLAWWPPDRRGLRLIHESEWP